MKHRTVGEMKQSLADLLGIPLEDIGHYVLAVENQHQIVLSFCCDDREVIAGQLREAADAVLNVVGRAPAGFRRPPPCLLVERPVETT